MTTPPWTQPSRAREHSRTPAFLFIALIFAIALFSYRSTPLTMTTTELAGWYTRATPANDDAFEPTRDKLAFAIFHSTPVTPEGFTLALFTPNLALDAHGTLLTLQPSDFAGLVSLARSTLDLPRPFQWRVKSAVTSRPIDNVAFPEEGVAYGVYNWNVQSKELDKETDGRTELPEEIYELLKLAKEAVGEQGWARPVPELGQKVRGLFDDPR